MSVVRDVDRGARIVRGDIQGVIKGVAAPGPSVGDSILQLDHLVAVRVHDIHIRGGSRQIGRHTPRLTKVDLVDSLTPLVDEADRRGWNWRGRKGVCGCRRKS